MNMGRWLRGRLLWAVWHIPLGPLAPHVLGLGLSRKARRVNP